MGKELGTIEEKEDIKEKKGKTEEKKLEKRDLIKKKEKFGNKKKEKMFFEEKRKLGKVYI